MKFHAKWFLDGKEVELPEMRIEGSLAVAELTNEHVDEFIPFVTTIQEEQALRLRLDALLQLNIADKDATDDQIATGKAVLHIYKKDASDDVATLKKQCSTLAEELTAELLTYVEKTARVTIQTTPFFLKRSIIEAYYMMKAYVWEEARKAGNKPTMPFTLEELKMMIADDEIALFSKHSMEKVKQQTVDKATPETPDELKKKSAP